MSSRVTEDLRSLTMSLIVTPAILILSLLLLMSRIFTNDSKPSFPSDDFALITYFLDRSLNLHAN